MDTQKIQNFEDGVKNLFYAEIADVEKHDLMKGFWDHHVKLTIEASRDLAKKYDADEEVCWLGAMLHDVGVLDAIEPHDILGAEKAYELLIKEGFSENIAEKVKAITLCHRCKASQPETLEEKIVSTADAMTHFHPPFYLGIAIAVKEEYDKLIHDSIQKLEKDYEQKIFFDDEKKMLHERMNDFRLWLAEKSEKI